MRIRLGMPDALDLTVICVEAGLSLDQAMMRVGEDLRHAHPELADELYLMNLELRAGKPRADFRNLYNRTGVDDIKALVTTLVQTDRFGTSLAQALRVHSDSLRTEHQQRAEEQAAKTTIKMVPPGGIRAAIHHHRDSRPGNYFAVPHADRMSGDTGSC